MEPDLLVFLKKGDQTEQGATLFREYERVRQRPPATAWAPDFLWIVDRKFTITVAEEGSWWAGRLREAGWAVVPYETVDEFLHLGG